MKKVRMTALLAAFAMTAGMLAGCGSTDKTTTNVPAGKEEDLAYKISDKPIEFSLFYAGLNGTTPYEDDYPVFVEARRLTNIGLKGTVATTNADPIQAFNTMMVSGNLDDLVTAYKADFDKYAGQGAFIPLDDLIDEYAPNLRNFLEEHTEVKKGITSFDGHIYFIPRVEQGETAKGWYIRTDWLEKLGLNQPKTVDEVHDVLMAFKTQDPNGNGQADEVPYFNREQTLNDIYNLFGLRKDFFVRHLPYHGTYSSANSAFLRLSSMACRLPL